MRIAIEILHVLHQNLTSFVDDDVIGWHPVPRKLGKAPDARIGYASTVHQGKLIISGGHGEDNIFEDVFSYNIGKPAPTSISLHFGTAF